jgi:RimJ/RimL family protein N-acetyltransferase
VDVKNIFDIELIGGTNMYFKKMTGKKCYLSPIDMNDVEKYTEWLNDLEITKYLTLYPYIISFENEKEFLDKLSKGHNYSIIDNNTNELIGNCGFGDIDHINQTAEAGIFIGNNKYLNNGYGTEALSLLLDYGFKALNFHNIFLRIFSFNERAKKCYEKIGFKIIGKKREALLRGKERHDIILMDILYNDFYEKYNP